MKNIFTLFVLVSFFSTSLCIAQTLEENQKDEFTKKAIKRTSWETLSMSMSFTAYFRISKIDSTTYLDIKMMLGGASVFSISEGQELMFKLANEEIIKFSNLEYAITCTGCGAKGFVGSGAQGIKVSYYLDTKQSELLKNFLISKVRIYTNDGYVENEIKPSTYVKFKKALLLVQ